MHGTSVQVWERDMISVFAFTGGATGDVEHSFELEYFMTQKLGMTVAGYVFRPELLLDIDKLFKEWKESLKEQGGKDAP